VDAFSDQVAALRENWRERRELRMLADQDGDEFGAQSLVLLRLYDWVRASLEEVELIYAGEIALSLSERPHPPGCDWFRVAVGTDDGIEYSVSVTLVRASSGHAAIRATVTLPRSSAPVAVAPARHFGAWTRRGMQNVLLSLLTAYERDREPSPL
jgi:hypothetical protein